MKSVFSTMMVLTLLACSPGPKRSGEPVLEVVVYSIKKEYITDYPETTKWTRNLLQQLRGFRSIKTTASLERPGVFVDQCEWETLDDAKAAAEAVQKMPEFKPIFAMMDSVLYFDHLKPIDTP